MDTANDAHDGIDKRSPDVLTGPLEEDNELGNWHADRYELHLNPGYVPARIATRLMRGELADFRRTSRVDIVAYSLEACGYRGHLR